MRHEKTDRTPYLEMVVEKRNLDAVLGRSVRAGSLNLDPADHVEFAQKSGMDAIGFGVLWELGRVHESAQDGSRHYVDGRIKDWDDLAREAPPPDIRIFTEKLERYLEAVEGTDIGVWVYFHGPFDTAYTAMGYTDFMYALYDKPDLVEHLMDMGVDYYGRAVRELSKYPVSFLWAADDVAQKDSLMIAPEQFRLLWFDRMRKMIEPAHKRGIPLLFHSDGYITALIPMLLELGVSGIHPMEPAGGNDIYWIKQNYGDRLCLVGNIDVSGPLSCGTPEQVHEEVVEHITRLGADGGYIVSSSHSIVDSVKPDNYRAMLQSVWGCRA